MGSGGAIAMLALGGGGGGDDASKSSSQSQQHKYEAVSIEGIRSSLQRALREMKEMSAERQTTADKMDVELAAADKQVCSFHL